ncbi:MAG: hypothetical protein ABI844_00460 [Saprospiraceae bacterium]
MSNDKLKKFVENHRSEFENDIPSLKVWANIEKALPASISQKPHTGRTIAFQIMKIAAGVCILLMTGAGAGIYMNQAKYGEAASISNMYERNEYMEAKTYFTNQIDAKINELEKYNTDHDLMKELQQIDQVSTELKMEILKNPDQDQDLLIKQMIKQYQQKLSTLNKILQKLEENHPNKLNKTSLKASSNDTLQL